MEKIFSLDLDKRLPPIGVRSMPTATSSDLMNHTETAWQQMKHNNQQRTGSLQDKKSHNQCARHDELDYEETFLARN